MSNYRARIPVRKRVVNTLKCFEFKQIPGKRDRLVMYDGHHKIQIPRDMKPGKSLKQLTRQLKAVFADVTWSSPGVLCPDPVRFFSGE